jgi:potassium large conductance calcium-activated channel subfamily M alpha member 1
MFASSIPEIIELVGSGSKYGGELKREHGKRYINEQCEDILKGHSYFSQFSHIFYTYSCCVL